MGTKDCSNKIRNVPHFKEMGFTIERYTQFPRHTGRETKEWDFLKVHRVVKKTHNRESPENHGRGLRRGPCPEVSTTFPRGYWLIQESPRPTMPRGWLIDSAKLLSEVAEAGTYRVWGTNPPF